MGALPPGSTSVSIMGRRWLSIGDGLDLLEEDLNSLVDSVLIHGTA